MEASPASINDGRVDAKELRLGSNGHAASIFLKTFLNRAEIFRLHPDASSAGRQRGLCSDLASTGCGFIRTPILCRRTHRVTSPTRVRNQTAATLPVS